MPLDPDEYFLALHASMASDVAAQDEIFAIKHAFDERLWHEFSCRLLQLALANQFIRSAAMDLHEHVVSRVRLDLSPDIYVKFVYLAAQAADASVPTSDQLEMLSSAYSALVTLGAFQHMRAVSCIRAIVLMSVASEATLEARRLLADVQEYLKTVAAQEINVVVMAMYHRALVRMHELSGDHDAFYKTIFSLTTYAEAAALPVLPGEMEALAYKTSMAGLLGKGIYNFGQLINFTPFREVLRASANHAWVLELVERCNGGDVAQTAGFLDSVRSRIAEIPDLAAAVSSGSLLRKVHLMALLNLVFNTPAESRVFQFGEIAAKCRVELHDVEPLVLTAFALGLLQGSIDELEQTVECTWVQPRVLSLPEVRVLAERIGNWRTTVRKTSAQVADLAKEIPK